MLAAWRPETLDPQNPCKCQWAWKLIYNSRVGKQETEHPLSRLSSYTAISLSFGFNWESTHLWTGQEQGVESPISLSPITRAFLYAWLHLPANTLIHIWTHTYTHITYIHMKNKGFQLLIFQLQFYLTSFRQNSTIRITHFNLKKAMGLISVFLIKKCCLLYLFIYFSLYHYINTWESSQLL